MMKIQQSRFFMSLTAVVLFLLCVPVHSAAQKKDGSVKTIVIDAGHGGRDPGACYAGYKEKDIVLDVALLLGEMIKKNLPDMKVIYTRDKDVFIELYKRGDIANKAKADLFLSIHANAMEDASQAPSKALTLVLGPNRMESNLKESMKENEAILYEDNYKENYRGYDPNSVDSFIIFSFMQYVNLDQSLKFAEIIQKHYKTDTPMPDGGVRQQCPLVLWKTTMPAVLTEIGFIQNAKDRKVMAAKDGRKKIARALFNAVSEYKAQVEGNRSPVKPGIGDVDDAGSGSAAEMPFEGNSSKSKVVYRVQVCNSPKKISKGTGVLKPFKSEVVKEVKVGMTYKYYVGECKTYAEASKKQTEVRKHVKDAFMVAFDGDKQLKVSDARKITD